MLVALTVTACVPADPPPPERDGPPPVEADGLRYETNVRITPAPDRTVVADVEISNPGETGREIVFPDGCVVLLRLYGEPGPRDRPAWDQARHVACTQALVPLRLEPGESSAFRSEALVTEILGDSLPPGRYSVEVLLRPDGESLELTVGVVELDV